MLLPIGLFQVSLDHQVHFLGGGSYFTTHHDSQMPLQPIVSAYSKPVLGLHCPCKAHPTPTPPTPLSRAYLGCTMRLSRHLGCQMGWGVRTHC